MKRFAFTLLLILCALITFAQAPQAINYQTVIRDITGALIQEQTVALRISIHQNAPGGPVVYQETFSPTTNKFGLVTIELGNGAPVSGSFPDIDWGAGDHFVESELDPAGGTNFTSMGTSQLLSVAYALHAETSGDSHWQKDGDDIYTSVSGNVGIGTANPSKKLHVIGGIEQEYTGTGNALTIGGTTAGSMCFILNNNVGNGIGLNAGLMNSSAGTTSIGVMGYNSGEGRGVYGINQNHFNFGFLGDPYRGAYGQNHNGHFGILGDTAYGVYGRNSNGHFGSIGNASTGVMGQYSNGNFGSLGNLHEGVYGESHYGTAGVLGDNAYGAFAYHPSNIAAFLASSSEAVYGVHDNGNYGFIAGNDYGILGVNWIASNYGFFGNADYGAYGSNINGHFGALGEPFSGVYGEHSNGNSGMLGGEDYGAYGESTSGSFGALGDTYSGVYGRSSTFNEGSLGNASNGVSGYNNNWNHGILGDDDYGAYGQHWMASTFGFLGSMDYGAYGEDLYEGNYGFLGSEDYGAFGENINGNYSALGTENYAVFSQLISDNPGDFAVFGSGVQLFNSSAQGTGYNFYEAIGGVAGYNYYSNQYSFGVIGYTYLEEDRSGGTFGGFIGGSGVEKWGCLAYQASGASEYGGYFTSYTSGGGEQNEVHIDNGIGVWGDLFGAEIHGRIYGAYIEGENYATYTNGDNYTNGLDVHLQKDSNGENKALYTNVSTDATVQTCGFAQLSNGESTIAFDEAFAAVVSSKTPVVVTVTPIGNSNGVHLAEVNAGGFKVVENNGGKSDVTLSYIAIGQRAGLEEPQLPQEVVNADYIEKLSRGLHNDGNTETSGEGLYYENGKLTVGIHQSALADPNRTVSEIHSVKHPEKPVMKKPDIREREVNRPHVERKEIKLPEKKRPEIRKLEKLSVPENSKTGNQ